MLCDEQVAPVCLGEHVARIELQSQWCDVRSKTLCRLNKFGAIALIPEFRIADIATVAIRISKMRPFCFKSIEFAWGYIIAQFITTVIGEPQHFCVWMPGKSYSIAYAMGNYLPPRAIGVDPRKAGIDLRLRFTNVAGRAHG